MHPIPHARSLRPAALLLAAFIGTAAPAQRAGELPAVRSPASPPAQPERVSGAPLTLELCVLDGIAATVQCGVLEVFENRDARTGRRLELAVVRLPSRSETPAAEPIFYLAGGPGQSATAQAARLWLSPLRDRRTIVLVDQRGTSGSHALDCTLTGSDEHLQGYFEPIFQVTLLDACRRTLEQRADLRWYTTAVAMDDLDDARAALGYDRIDLVGQSYGTRAVLTYVRRYPQRARAAYLIGLVPPAFRNPLHHARAAQEALDLLIAACERDPRCQGAYPHLRAELASVVMRLDRQPATVSVRHPVSQVPVEISLTRTAFAEALRVMMYGTEHARRIPLLIHRAYRGDFVPFAELGLASNRGLRNDLRIGLLMSVVCTEDVPRITDADVVRETRGTLLGDSRVRQQMAACARWPKGNVPGDHADPVAADVPMLLVSGTLDPVTPRHWGEETARHLPRSMHLVVPGGHGPTSPCLDAVATRFLDRGTTDGLEAGCVLSLEQPSFLLPDESAPNARAASGRDSLVVSTASGTALEERGREQLLRLVATYDVDRWLFTRTVRIQSRAIPHSHPVLTLNTRYLANDTAQLATFLHEQFHWYVSARPDSAVRALTAELRRLYPDAPDRGPAGARDLESTYLHLIICTLEYEATAAVFGRDIARRTLEGWTHYTWVYRTVLADTERLVALLARHGFGIDAGAQ